jgi:hypothetical protein
MKPNFHRLDRLNRVGNMKIWLPDLMLLFASVHIFPAVVDLHCRFRPSGLAGWPALFRAVTDLLCLPFPAILKNYTCRGQIQMVAWLVLNYSLFSYVLFLSNN